MNAQVLPDRAEREGLGMTRQEFEEEFGLAACSDFYVHRNSGIRVVTLTYQRDYVWQIAKVTFRDGRAVEVTIDD